MTFPSFLRAQVERLGSGHKRIGELRCASALGVTDRTIRLWCDDSAKPPAKGMQAGAHLILPTLSPPPPPTTTPQSPPTTPSPA